MSFGGGASWSCRGCRSPNPANTLRCVHCRRARGEGAASRRMTSLVTARESVALSGSTAAQSDQSRSTRLLIHPDKPLSGSAPAAARRARKAGPAADSAVAEAADCCAAAVAARVPLRLAVASAAWTAASGGYKRADNPQFLVFAATQAKVRVRRRRRRRDRRLTRSPGPSPSDHRHPGHVLGGQRGIPRRGVRRTPHSAASVGDRRRAVRLGHGPRRAAMRGVLRPQRTRSLRGLACRASAPVRGSEGGGVRGREPLQTVRATRPARPSRLPFASARL